MANWELRRESDKVRPWDLKQGEANISKNNSSITRSRTINPPPQIWYIYIYIRVVHGSGWVGFVPNPDSTCLGWVEENQTRNRQPITTSRVGLGSKKQSVGSVETDEWRRRAEEDETSSDLVRGKQNIADLSLNIAGSKPKSPIQAYTSPIQA